MSKLKTILALFLSIIIIGFVSCKGGKSTEQNNESEILSIPDDEFGSSLDDEIYQDSPDTIGNLSVYQEDESGNLTNETAQVTNENNVFYIIAGSFTVYSNAENLCQKLKAKGFDSKILEPYGQYHRVSLQSYKTREEAREAIPSMKNKLRHENIWILKR